MESIVLEISRAAPVLYPRLAQVFDETGLSLAGFFLLSSLRHSAGQTLRYSDVHDLLQKVMQYNGPDVTRLVQRLEKDRLAKREILSDDTFRQAFGPPRSHERRVSIKLLQGGERKLDEFNGRIEQLLQDLLGTKVTYVGMVLKVLRHITKTAGVATPPALTQA